MAMSFGAEGVDRYIVVYKRESPPSEDEIAARRDGLEWNESKAKEYRENVTLLMFYNCNMYRNRFRFT